MVSRRGLCRFLGSAALAGLTRFTAGEETPSTADTRAMAQVARQFMQEFAVPALSIAVARQGNIVYREAFGEADKEFASTGNSQQPLSDCQREQAIYFGRHLFIAGSRQTAHRRSRIRPGYRSG